MAKRPPLTGENNPGEFLPDPTEDEAIQVLNNAKFEEYMRYGHNKDEGELIKDKSVMASNAEDLQTPDKAVAKQEYPQSKFSFWYSLTIESSILRENFTSTMANVYIHPTYFAQAFSIANQVYHMFRNGLDNQDLQKEIDADIYQLHLFSIALGRQLNKAGNEQDINWEVYGEAVGLLQQTWSKFFDAQHRLGLLIHFAREKEYKTILRKYRKTEDAVDQTETAPVVHKEDVPQEAPKEAVPDGG